MSKARWSAVMIVAVAVRPAAAQTKLEWHFKEGETFFVESVAVQKQTVEIKSKLLKEERTRTWVTAVTVMKKTSAGHVLDLKIESVTLQPAAPGTPAGLDDKLAAKMQGCQFTATVTSQGKLAKFEGYDAFVQKLAEKNGEVEKVLRALLSEEALREDIEEVFYCLPHKAVKKGDKWKREAIEPVPPFGSFKSTVEYVLEEETGDELSVGTTIKMTYKPSGGDGDLFRVVKGGLTSEGGKGSVVFDAKKGRMVRSEKTVELQGDLVVESMGNQTQLRFTSVNVLRVRLYDK
jgi:hypothetical protein